MKPVIKIASKTLVCVLFCFTIHAKTEGIPSGVVNLGAGPYYSNQVIVVDKSARTVTVWEQKGNQISTVREYPADFGKMTGDKEFQGDHKTPEGIYEFTGVVEKARLDFQEYGHHEVKAYPMNYPNLFDRREGKTGAGIWLHAIPDGTPLTRGSRGCVVLTKEHTEEIGQFIKPQNTPIIVNDKVVYLSPKEIQGKKDIVISFLKKWLDSWQNKKMTEYMAFYDSSFRSRKMDFAQWERYKAGLAQERSEITITISEPRVLRHKDEWVIQFFQKYRSDDYEDFGHKTLYVKGTDVNNLKIIAEDFDVVQNQTALAQFDSKHFTCCEARTVTNN